MSQLDLLGGETATPNPDDLRREALARWMAGFLATWNLGDKKPTKPQQAALLELGRRTADEARRITSKDEGGS